MSGNKAAGLKIKARLLAKDPLYYVKLGKLGGSAPKSRPSGWAAMDPEKHKRLSADGGRKSKRS